MPEPRTVDEPGDPPLVAGAAATDGFLALFRRHGAKVYNFARRLAGNEPDAADLVQEAASRAFSAFHRYDRDRPFDAWMCRILHNIFIDQTRRYEHRHAVSLDAPPPAAESSWEEILPGRDPDPFDTASRGESHIWVQRALAELPPLFRSAVALCDVEGYSYERIAEILECPLGTVRSRIHEGRRLFREAYKRFEEGKRR